MCPSRPRGQAERGTWERRRPRLRNAAEDTIFVKNTMREERYVMLCGNMKHGRHTLHSAGGARDMGAQASSPAECIGRHNICLEYNAGREICHALQKYETWTVCAAFRRRSAGHGSAGVPACGMYRKTQYLLKRTMREERYVRLCENMKHGRHKLHSAGGDACDPMSCDWRPGFMKNYQCEKCGTYLKSFFIGLIIL